MDRAQNGGVVLAVVSAIAAPVISMSWPHPTAAQLHIAWGVLALLFFVGVALIVWPKSKKDTDTMRKTPAKPKREGPTMIDATDSVGFSMENCEITGPFDVGVDLTGAHGGRVIGSRISGGRVGLSGNTRKRGDR